MVLRDKHLECHHLEFLLGGAWYQAAPGADALVCSTPERAMLELCADASDAALIYEVDALMQAMTTLRPQRVGVL
ncbi:type IV toxin-antitoxin system AbiEi family antitoxin domain-containing protein, partial [Burkholderia vietnamiensis]|nr:type IV toxin-antitoxin system AbiEi family antitoxin domain-containing protein [Burkholderia vietnamiensis]